MNRVETYSENYRWKIWGVMAIAFFIVFFNRYTLAVISNDLSANLKLTGVQLSNLASMYYYSYGFMQIPVGIFADTIGPRKSTTYGMIICGVNIIVFAVASNIWILYLSRLFFGVGASTILISILKVLSTWFPSSEFVKVNGWTTFIGNLGGLFASAPFAMLITFIDWRIIFVILGVISLFVSSVIWKIASDYPSNEKQYNRLKGREIFRSFITIGKKSSTWVYFFMLFSIYGMMTSFVGLWGNAYISQTYSVSNQVASNHVMFYILGFIGGSLVVGWIERKVKNQNLMIKASTGITALLWFSLIYIFKLKPNLWVIDIIFFTLGFVAIFASVIYSKVKETSQENLLGFNLGIINLAPFLGSSLSNYFVGKILDKTWNGNIYNGVRYYDTNGYLKAFKVYLLLSCISFVVSIFFINKKVPK